MRSLGCGLAGGVLLFAGVVAAAEVFPSAEAVEPLGVGSAVPEAKVRTVAGEAVDLAARLRDRGALLVFYRGGW